MEENLYNRIGEADLNPTYKDGQVYQHTDVNNMLSILKLAVNENYYDIQRLWNGTKSVGNATNLDGAELSRYLNEELQADDNKIPSSQQAKAYIDGVLANFNPPVRGVDYWTEEDQEYVIDDSANKVMEAISEDFSVKKVYSSVNSMIEDEELLVGMYARTLGYYQKDDNGGALYKIRSGTADDIYSHQLTNGNVAELVNKNCYSILQLGAKGDNNFDNTEIFREAIYENSNDKTIVIPEGIYLTKSIDYTGANPFRNNVTIKGINRPTIKIDHRTATETLKGTYTGNYTVSEGIGTLNFGSSCTINTITTESGRKFYYLAISDATLIPAYLQKEMVLKGNESKTRAIIASIDTDNPDGAGTARIYLYETFNNDNRQLHFKNTSNVLNETLIVKETIDDSVFYISFPNNTIPTYIDENNIQIRQSNGNKARISSIDKNINNTNYLVIDCFNDDYYNITFTDKEKPIDNSLPFEVVKFANAQPGFMTLNKFTNVNISGIKFDGANYNVSKYQGSGNDYNMIYLNGSKNITIDNCEFSNCIMSGLHIGGSGNAQSCPNHDYPENVLVNNCKFNNNGRGDLEIIYGKNIKIINCKGSGYLDIETNGNEILEEISIENCVFKYTTPYAPAVTNASSIINYSNCKFYSLTANNLVILNLNGLTVHDISGSHGAVINASNCVINHLGGYAINGNDILNFDSCLMYGLDCKLPSLNGETEWNFDNCTIDLSLIRFGVGFGIKKFNVNNSIILSATDYLKMDDVGSTFNCSNTTFKNVGFNSNRYVPENKFNQCQFLLKDTNVQKPFGNGNFGCELKDCYIETTFTSTNGKYKVFNCILSAISQPYLVAGKGLYANGVCSSEPSGISWVWAGASASTDNNDEKVNFQNVYLNKNVPGKLGVGTRGYPVSKASVSDSCKAFWVNNDDIVMSRIYYNSDSSDTNLYIKNISFT